MVELNCGYVSGLIIIVSQHIRTLEWYSHMGTKQELGEELDPIATGMGVEVNSCTGMGGVRLVFWKPVPQQA